MKIGSLFSGVDGLGLGFENVGLGEVVWQAECDPNPSTVLRTHWPEVPNHGNVTTVKWEDVEPATLMAQEVGTVTS